eukprot:1161866-Pelagomonas_calceolata.AAC.10
MSSLVMQRGTKAYTHILCEALMWTASSDTAALNTPPRHAFHSLCTLSGCASDKVTRMHARAADDATA